MPTLKVIEKPGSELSKEQWEEISLMTPVCEILLIQDLSLEENFLNLN